MADEKNTNDKPWELVVGGTMKNGLLEGGEVKGTFPTRDDAEAEGAQLRRNADQSIRARLAGDTHEKLHQRRMAAKSADVPLIVAIAEPTALTPAPTPPKK